ncbi:MAG: hypothetical protein WDM78_18645 [Puia sp.]
MSFAMSKWNTLSQAEVLGKIFRRTAIIFLCGFLLYWFPFYHIDHATHNMVFSSRFTYPYSGGTAENWAGIWYCCFIDLLF